MDKNTATRILQSTKSGNFTAALDLIHQSPSLSTDNAIKVFIFTVTACGDCPPGEKLNEDKLILLLETVLKAINSASDSQLLQYCQSIFYIFKYFLDKKSFENATKIHSILTPSFLIQSSCLKSNAKIKSTFSSLTNMLSNSIIKLSQSKDESCNENLTKFTKMVLKVSSLVYSKTEVLKSGTRMVKVFNILHIHPLQLIELYQYILELVDLEVLQNNCESIFSILETVLTYFLKNKYFQETRLLLCESKLCFEDQLWKHIHVAFDAILICCPDYKITDKNFDKWKSNVYAFKKQNLTWYKEAIKTIDWPMHFLFKYYRDESSLWCNLPKDTFLKILEVTNIIVKDLTTTSSNKKECGCGSSCSITTNHYGAIQFGSPLARLLKEYLQNHKDCSEEIYMSILNYLQHLLTLVEPLKNNNCSKWSLYWSEITLNIYNTATVLYIQQNSLHKHLYKIVLKYYFKYNETGSSNFKDNILENAFNSICSQYFQEGDLEKAMTFAAFYCFSFPKQRNLAFVNWFLKPKNIVKEKPDKSHYIEWTLASILEENIAKLDDFVIPGFKLTKDEKVDLLCFELSQYKAKYPSKLSMMIALKQLSEFADSETLSNTILQIYGDGTVPIHDEMHLVFSAIRKRLEKEPNLSKNTSLKLGLAVLYYYRYKKLSKDTANKNIEAMERTMMFEKKETVIEGIPKDSNDECDIVSAYEDLRLNILTKLLDILDQSLTYLTSVAKTGLNDLKLADCSNQLSILIGFEYRVHCFGIKSLQAFETSLTFANLSQNQEKQLLSLSYLIENANTNSSFATGLILKSKNLEMILLKSNENNKYNKTLIIYYLCKAKAFLHKNNNLAYDACKKAEALFSEYQGKRDTDMLKAEWFILMYKLTKSCEFHGEEHIKEPMTMKLHMANDIVVTYGTKNGNFYGAMEPQQQCIFFDAVMELTKAYYLLKLPRDLRCYSKNTIILSQKLVLPLRCVSFLVYLAHSDLLCCKFDHCSIKIKGINDIFCLENCRHNFLLTNDVPQKKIEEQSDHEIDRISNRIQEMALDLPKHYNIQLSPSSPTLVIEGFKKPAFLTHETSCNCFSCICIEHHILLLEKTRLEALINSYQNQHKVADDFLQGALRLYKRLKGNLAYYKKKSQKLISEDLIVNFEEKFFETYGNILLDYSFHLVRTGFKEKSMEVNLKLLQMLQPRKVEFIYLYSEALLQRASYLIPKAVKCEPDSIELEDGVLTVDESGEYLVKTPETKQNKVTVTVSHHEHEKQPAPKRRLKKVSLFENFSMEKESKEVATPKSGILLGKNKNPFFFTEGTPMLEEKNMAFKTPKVQVYSDKMGSASKSRKKFANKTEESYLGQMDTVSVPDIKQPLLASGSSSRKQMKYAQVVEEQSSKVVPSIKKNLMSEWAMPSSTTRTYTRIRKPQKTDLDSDTKNLIKIYSDVSSKAQKKKSTTIKELIFYGNIEVKREKTDDILSSDDDEAKKPQILAGCSALRVGKKKEPESFDNIKSISTRKTSNLDKKIVNDIDSISNKLQCVKIKSGFKTEIESSSSNSSCKSTPKASPRSEKNVGETLNRIDIKSNVLTEKIKTRSRIKKEITESSSTSSGTSSSSGTKYNEGLRKSSRKRVL